MIDNYNYLLAVRDISYRPSFVGSINLNEAGQYISQVEYKNNLSKSEKKVRMSTRKPSTFSRENKSKVLIYSLAFDLKFHPNFQDFYSTLVHHEGLHAKENLIGSPMPICAPAYDLEYWVAFDLLQEVRAVRNQLMHLTQENSEIFKCGLKERLSNYLRELFELNATNLVELYGTS
jgi:hypothetical protein